MEIYTFLNQHGIEYERHDHPAVYTCEEANRLVPTLPGAKTKNIFMRDKKGRTHFLLVVGDQKQVDLRTLAPLLDTNKLSLASAERLKKHLGIDPGSVSALSLINDTSNAVKVIVDSAIWNSQAILCHPLVNTSTLVISQQGFRMFLEKTGHTAHVLDVPERQ